MEEKIPQNVDLEESTPYTPMLVESDRVRSSNGTLQQCTQDGTVLPVLDTGPSEEAAAEDEVFRREGNDGDSGRSPQSPVRKTRSGASTDTKQSVPSRIDPKISTIRQHYYPEGGWGWIICACGFVINMMTTGLLLSYGILYTEVIKEFGEQYSMEAMWLGSLSLAMGLFLSPLIVALCRRKSTRLTAVFGGLTSALGCLFTSFASQLHQVFFSYGVILAVGLGLCRETSNLMAGQYFKRRRECVEMVVQSGSGVGVAVFSFAFRKIVRTLGWRLGLHAVTGIVVVPFFVGICYRSASLYHPQRRAILHLKNQRKKIKDKNIPSDKPPFFDFSSLRSRDVLTAMLAAAVCSFGLYAPFFYFVPLREAEGLDETSVLFLQLHLGCSFSVGCWIFGLLVIRRSPQCMIASQYLCQSSMIGVGVALLSASAVQGYHGYILFAWMYGIFSGGLHYVLKMFVFERIRARTFGRAWGYVQWSQSVPVLVGIPITGYINRDHGAKTGFFFSAACAFAGAVVFFILDSNKESESRRGQGSCSTCTSAMTTDLTRDFASDRSGGTCTCNSSLHCSSHPATADGVCSSCNNRPDSSNHHQPVDATQSSCSCTSHSHLCSQNSQNSMNQENSDASQKCSTGSNHTHCVGHHAPLPEKHPVLKCQRTISFATSVDESEEDAAKKPELLTCISEEGLVDFGMCNVQDRWFDAECLSSCIPEENFLLQQDYEEKGTYEDDPGRTFHAVGTIHNRRKDDHFDSIKIAVPKRAITVIEEVTSSV